MKWIQILLLTILVACNNERGESAECMSVREQAYKAALGNQREEGHKLLSAAKASCGPASEYYLDRVRRVLERIERRESQTKAQAIDNNGSPLRSFVEWIGRLREAKNKAVGTHSCAPRGSERFGLCESRVTVDGSTFELTYSIEDRDAVGFSYSSPGLLTCIDLGEHRDISRWTTSGRRFEHCDLSSHSLRGLSALIAQTEERSVVTVYSAEFKEQVPDFRRQLER